MKYVLATLACVIICIVYVLIGAGLGWENGGGIIPMTILLAVVGVTWRGITKNKVIGKSQEANPSNLDKALDSEMHENEKA